MLILLLGTKVSGDKSSWEWRFRDRKFLGTKVPRDKSSRGRKL